MKMHKKSSPEELLNASGVTAQAVRSANSGRLETAHFVLVAEFANARSFALAYAIARTLLRKPSVCLTRR